MCGQLRRAPAAAGAESAAALAALSAGGGWMRMDGSAPVSEARSPLV